MRLWGVLTLLLTVGAVSARADGLVQRLPDDGTSVRFGMELKVSHNGMEKTATGELIQSSVGKAEANGMPCRWIEFKMVFDIDGNQMKVITKTLIPEKALKAGENPGAHIVRGWIQQRGQEVEALNDLQNSKAGPLGAFLSGPAPDAKKLPKETLDSKLGKLECEGVTGSLTLDQGEERVKLKVENRLHDKAAFGIVRSRMEFEVERNGQARESGVITLNALEVTKNIKSELAEKN